jgi:hypothetical protein
LEIKHVEEEEEEEMLGKDQPALDLILGPREETSATGKWQRVVVFPGPCPEKEPKER